RGGQRKAVALVPGHVAAEHGQTAARIQLSRLLSRPALGVTNGAWRHLALTGQGQADLALGYRRCGGVEDQGRPPFGGNTHRPGVGPEEAGGPSEGRDGTRPGPGHPPGDDAHQALVRESLPVLTQAADVPRT